MTTLWAFLVMLVALSVRPAEAAPFAYVPNFDSNNVSVIDTATNAVVATVPVEGSPNGIAVTPDGKPVKVGTVVATPAVPTPGTAVAA